MSAGAVASCWGPDFPDKAEGLSAGIVRLVALGVADVVNDLHHHEFFAARATLAGKVGVHPDTISDVMHHLVAAGVVVVVNEPPVDPKTGKPRKTGKPTTYRWIWGCGERPHVADEQGYGDSPHGVRSSAARGAVTSPHKLNSTATEPKPVLIVDPEAERLCRVLADNIEERGSKRPNVTKEWIADMDRLLRIDKRDPAKVENLLRWVETSAFWRPNIRSPRKFREQYDRLREVATSELRQRNGVQPMPAPDLWDRDEPSGVIQVS